MVAKAGLGLIGLGALGVGSVSLAKPGWLGMGRDPMPECHYLSEDNGFPEDTTNYSEGKFGKKYGRYLVGVSNKGSSVGSINKGWWEWAYRRWDRSNANDKNGKFKNLNPENGNGANVLKKLCEEAYKQETTALKGDGDTSVEATEFKKSEVWKYCSPGTLVTLINESHGDGTTIGSNSTNKTTLVSVESSLNDWFWEIRNKDFWEASGDWSGSGATNESNKSVFKEAFEKKSATENDKSSRKTVKELCDEAYKLNKDSKPTDNTDAQKFCKLETN